MVRGREGFDSVRKPAKDHVGRGFDYRRLHLHMRDDRLTSPDQLLPGMLVMLCSEIYGRDTYRVDCKPYVTVDGWCVKLTHFGSVTSMEYTLDELGITARSILRWVETDYLHKP